jgi:hypothetical protein
MYPSALPASIRMQDRAPSGQHPQLVQVVVEVGGITEDPEGTRSDQFVLALAAAEQPDAEHCGPARSHQVPYCVADDTCGAKLPSS